MKKLWLCLCAGLLPLAAAAAWVFLDDNRGNGSEYYETSIENKGRSSVIKTFAEVAVKGQAPSYDPKTLKVTGLVPFLSELSSYEFNCKDQSVQLTSRTFYVDRGGKVPLMTHKENDKFIQESNSDFAKQFRKTPVNLDSEKMVKLSKLACK